MWKGFHSAWTGQVNCNIYAEQLDEELEISAGTDGGLHMFDHLLSPPSTPVEIVRRLNNEKENFVINFLPILGDCKHFSFLVQRGGDPKICFTPNLILGPTYRCAKRPGWHQPVYTCTVLLFTQYTVLDRVSSCKAKLAKQSVCICNNKMPYMCTQTG